MKETKKILRFLESLGFCITCNDGTRRKQRIKVRRSWGELNPMTKIRGNKKAYSRKNFKISIDN